MEGMDDGMSSTNNVFFWSSGLGLLVWRPEAWGEEGERPENARSRRAHRQSALARARKRRKSPVRARSSPGPRQAATRPRIEATYRALRAKPSVEGRGTHRSSWDLGVPTAPAKTPPSSELRRELALPPPPPPPPSRGCPVCGSWKNEAELPR